MARVEVPVVVINSSTGLPVNGAAVAVSHRSTGTPATWYSAETGGTSSTAALITDANGRVTGWVERGAYNLAVSGTGITNYTEAWDAAPAGDATVDSIWVSETVLLPGEIKMYGGASIPTGWLACNGATVSRTTYARLFNAISTTWGAGDGSTTFALPDLRGRAPIGSGTGSGLTARALAALGGTETHTLTIAQIPAHNHPGSVGYVSTVGTNTNGQIAHMGDLSGTLQFSQELQISSQGSGNSFPIMQPFAVVTFLIKT